MRDADLYCGVRSGVGPEHPGFSSGGDARVRSWLLVFHIIGVAAWLGADIVQAVSTRRLAGAGGKVAGAWMRTTVAWGTTLYMPAGILILATGIGLVLDSSFFSFSDVFVSIGLLAIVVGVALGVTVFKRGGERAAAAFENGDDAAGQAEVNKLLPFGVFDTLLIVVAISAMVAKWGS